MRACDVTVQCSCHPICWRRRLQLHTVHSIASSLCLCMCSSQLPQSKMPVHGCDSIRRPIPLQDHAQISGSCGHRCCDICLRSYLGHGPFNSLGSEDGKQLLKIKKTFTDVDSDNEPKRTTILDSAVHCIHRRDGCRWAGELRMLKAHLTTCKYDAAPCRNGCGSMIPRVLADDHAASTCQKRTITCQLCGEQLLAEAQDNHRGTCRTEPIYCENKCGAKLQRRAMAAHRVSECAKRLVRCKHCRKEFVYDTLKTHLAQCPRYPESCPNRCTCSKLPREELEEHLNQHCKSICCVFKDMGCTFQGTRATVDEHLEKATRDHLAIVCLLVNKQQQQIRSLRSAVKELGVQKTGNLTWKITDYSSKMNAAKSMPGNELRSPAFYSSSCGYKLQAAVFLNGNGSGEGTHMSIYIRLVPGDYDALLKWPFSHAVTFTLYDQHGSEITAVEAPSRHIVESFIPEPSWEHFGRPKCETWSGSGNSCSDCSTCSINSNSSSSLGFGFPKFVSHELLRKRNYVKDEVLFVGVKIDQGKAIAV